MDAETAAGLGALSLPTGYGVLGVLALDKPGEVDLTGLVLNVDQRQPGEHV